MPRHVIHNDYHPGNLKFRDSDIIGLFDFDWSKIDYRCFDIALAITYFFSAWEGQQDGELQLDKTELFIAAYQNTLKGTPGLGPLSDLELKYLPHMISASNLYVLNWTITDFYGNKVDPDEYLVYLRHGVNFIKWLEMEENWRKLDSMVAKAAVNDVD